MTPRPKITSSQLRRRAAAPALLFLLCYHAGAQAGPTHLGDEVDRVPRSGDGQQFEPEMLPSPGARLSVSAPEDDGSIWLRGHDYKARIDPSGLTFIPFLGSDAPRNFPSRLAVGEVTVDGRPLELDRAARVEHTERFGQDGPRLSLRRGPLTVHFDAMARGIEQSFEVDVRGLDGDVEVRVDVRAPWQGRAEAEGFAWSGSRGGFHYGTAVALTPGGRSIPIPSRLAPTPAASAQAAAGWSGHAPMSIICRVPADVTRQCEGRVLVDPLISAYGFEQDAPGSGALTQPDVAFDLSTKSFLHVFQETFSQGDSDVWWVQRSSSGTVLASGAFDVSAAPYVDPKVASSNVGDCALIVAVRATHSAHSGRLDGQLFRFVPRTAGSRFTIAAEGTKSAICHPDVGGHQGTDGVGRFGVVYEVQYEEDSDVALRTVGVQGQLGPVVELSSGAGSSGRIPAISKSNGRGIPVDRWTVAWDQHDFSSGYHSVHVAQVRPTGSLIVPPTLFDLTFPDGEVHNLDVSDALEVPGSAEPQYMISYFDDRAQGAGRCQQWLALGQGERRVERWRGHEREHADLFRYRAAAQLGTTADRYLVVYCQEAETGATAWVTTYDPLQGGDVGISERRARLTEAMVTPNRGGPTAIASRWSGGMNSRWSSIAVASGHPLDSSITGLLFAATRPRANSAQYCYGFPNSTGERGFLQTSGNHSPYSFTSLRASRLPPGRLALWHVGFSAGYQYSPANTGSLLCLSGQIGVFQDLVAQISSVGTVSAMIRPDHLPPGLDPVQPGETLHISLGHTDTVNGQPMENFTNAVKLPVF